MQEPTSLQGQKNFFCAASYGQSLHPTSSKVRGVIFNVSAVIISIFLITKPCHSERSEESASAFAVAFSRLNQ
jgi:hypothetical protein